MKTIDTFKVYGTEVGSAEELRLDEISLLASPAVIRSLGEFFIEVSERMESEETEHVHLQDFFGGFDCDNHVDIILLNNNFVKLR